jgi:hypothetical protein
VTKIKNKLDKTELPSISRQEAKADDGKEKEKDK